jgi:hypothetical protein
MDPSGQVSLGQAPATITPSVGQTQVVAGPTTPPSNGALTQSPVDGGDDQGNVTLTPEQMAREITRLRRLEAEHRTARHDLESWKAERERADMTDYERVQADLVASERQRNELVTKHQEKMVAYETRLAAQELHFVDIADAVKLLDQAKIEFSDDGTPKNLSKLLKDLAADKPYLVGQATTPASEPAPRNGAPTNPASGAIASAILTEAQIAAMSPAEYKQNKGAIFQAMREGRIR